MTDLSNIEAALRGHRGTSDILGLVREKISEAGAAAMQDLVREREAAAKMRVALVDIAGAETAESMRKRAQEALNG